LLLLLFIVLLVVIILFSLLRLILLCRNHRLRRRLLNIIISVLISRALLFSRDVSFRRLLNNNKKYSALCFGSPVAHPPVFACYFVHRLRGCCWSAYDSVNYIAVTLLTLALLYVRYIDNYTHTGSRSLDQCV
jgi:hypothetical protein